MDDVKLEAWLIWIGIYLVACFLQPRFGEPFRRFVYNCGELLRISNWLRALRRRKRSSDIAGRQGSRSRNYITQQTPLLLLPPPRKESRQGRQFD